jgi:3-deoxy-manno-octulosonate cytidylyltransferase (CMP-KDO synthetase)
VTVLGVIPARWKSSRFPGKPLADIAGEPMILHVWRRVKKAKSIDSIIVATDDDRIASFCGSNHIHVEITSSDHETGTDRLAEVARRREADIYVNIQGDEPLIDPAAIDAVVDCLKRVIPQGTAVSTAFIPDCTPEQENDESVVHLVSTLDDHVLTFSRLPIPAGFREIPQRTVHVGLYAFTKTALDQFARLERGPVEKSESIELMRFLEHGLRIACVPIQSGSIGVDCPDDIALVEAKLRSR